MGDLDGHMDEEYLERLYEGMGYKVVSVRMIKDRVSGKAAGYCFLEFESEQIASTVLMTLNLKAWPGTDKLLKLNWASTNNRERQEHSVYVGELSSEVDDNQLFKHFASSLLSCRSAKVVCDNGGTSKGFGFVRFSSDNDARRAITDFNLTGGLGNRRIRVCKAFPKQGERNQGGGEQGGQHRSDPWSQYQQQVTAYNNNVAQYQQQYNEATDVEAYDTGMTAEQYNREFLDYDKEFTELLDGTRWQFVDTITAVKPIEQGA